MVKLQESKGRFFVTIPKEYILLKKWLKGRTLVLTVNDRNNIEIIAVGEQSPQSSEGGEKKDEENKQE